MATRGRKKMDMVKITSTKHMLVTFSKRRTGLFKKASELCTLTGSEIAVIVFSPSGKVFSFGSPGVSQILQRFQDRNSEQPISRLPLGEQRATIIESITEELKGLETQLDCEKTTSEGFEANKMNLHWWEGRVENMQWEQLEQLMSVLELLQNDIKTLLGN